MMWTSYRQSEEYDRGVAGDLADLYSTKSGAMEAEIYPLKGDIWGASVYAEGHREDGYDSTPAGALALAREAMLRALDAQIAELRARCGWLVALAPPEVE